MTTIKIEINLEPEDLFRFYDYHYWSSPDRKTFRFTRRITLVLSTLGFFTIFVIVSRGSEALLQPFGLFFMLAMGVFSYWWAEHGLLRRLRKGLLKNLNGGKNVDVLGRRTFEFGDDSFRVKSDHTDTTVSKKAIEKLREDQYSYYLYTSTMGAYILPKQQLTAEQRLAFENWC